MDEHSSDSSMNVKQGMNNYLSHSIADNKKRKTDSVNLNRPKKQKTASRNCSRFDCSTNIPEEQLNSIMPKEGQLVQAQKQQLLADIVEAIDRQDEPQAAVPFTAEKREWMQRFIENMLADRIDYKNPPRQTNFVESVEQKRPSIVNSNVNYGKTIVERVDFKKEENGNAISKIANSNFPAATSMPRRGINQSRKNEDYSDIMEQDSEDSSQFTCLNCCSICFRSLANIAVSSTNCGHIFCTPCIKAAVKSYRRCPICRKKLSTKKIHPLFM